MWCNEKTKIVEEKNLGFRLWQNLKTELLAKLKKIEFLHNINYGTNQRVRYWHNSKTWKTGEKKIKKWKPKFGQNQRNQILKKNIFDKKSLN